MVIIALFSECRFDHDRYVKIPARSGLSEPSFGAVHQPILQYDIRRVRCDANNSGSDRANAEEIKLVFAIVVMFLSSSPQANSFISRFKKVDGSFDVSDQVINNAVGFMPLPITITELAVGTGMGVATIFLHALKDYVADVEVADDEFALTDITAIAGANTDNESWFVCGGHLTHWNDDRIRHEGVADNASINLKCHAFPGATQFDDGIRFDAEGFFTEDPFPFRWKDSKVFLGASRDSCNTETTFVLGSDAPGIAPLELDAQLSGLGVFLLYGSLDNAFTANSGTNADMRVGRKDEAIGSDSEYEHFEASVHDFWKPARIGYSACVSIRRMLAIRRRLSRGVFVADTSRRGISACIWASMLPTDPKMRIGISLSAKPGNYA